MEEAYGIPWMEYNFFGPTKIEASIRAIAKRFDFVALEHSCRTRPQVSLGKLTRKALPTKDF
jgi:nitrogenase molybdenum-iron protein alpha/beta subunit